MAEKVIYDQKKIVHRSFNEFPVCTHGEGIYLYDEDGNRYIDGSSGSSLVCNIGHGVQSVVKAMHDQAVNVAYAAPHVFTNAAMLKLGEVISERVPDGLKNNCRTWITVSGTDAVDDAARLARQYWVSKGRESKHLVISRWRGFHGNNIAVAGFHGHTLRRSIYFPMYVNNPHIPPAYCYRCPFGDTYPDCGLKCAHALETEIRQNGADNIAAFIAEPIVGAALGCVSPPAGYYEVIRDICDRYDVLFIADEVMSGWARTGHWFAIEGWDVCPDIIATSKGMGAGYASIAAVIARDDIWQVLEDTGIGFLAGHTMNHNPVGCAGALAAIEYSEKHNLLENAREIGGYLLERMQEFLEFEIVGVVNGTGMMCGFELVKDKETKEPFDPALKVSALCQNEAMKRGLIAYACTGCVEGVAGDMIELSPPLITTREQVDEIIHIMKQTLSVMQEQLLGG